MTKSQVFQACIAQFEALLAVLVQSALAARDAAKHPESKAEDQYDTRGLEASYLAGAQSKRAAELEELIAMYRYVDIKDFTAESAIAATALVELESDGQHSYCLLMPKGGGTQVVVENKVVRVITPQSPLGEALLGRRAGDTIGVTMPREVRDYSIVSVC